MVRNATFQPFFQGKFVNKETTFSVKLEKISHMEALQFSLSGAL